jgi:hypothetical protein
LPIAARPKAELSIDRKSGGNSFNPPGGKLVNSKSVEGKLVISIKMGGKLVICRCYKGSDGAIARRGSRTGGYTRILANLTNLKE